MNLPAGDLAVRGPGIECRWFNSQLFSKVFDRQQHQETHRGSLPTPPSPPLRSRQHASVSWVAARCPRASGQPSCSLSGLPTATCTAPRLGFVPAPDCGGGQGTIVVIGRGPSVGLCPSAPHTAVGARAPSPSNSAPWPSALEASPTRSRRTRARLFRWPISADAAMTVSFSEPVDCSSLRGPSAAGDPNRDSCTSGTEASGLGCGATSDAHSADTVAPEGCSYAGTRCDLDRPRHQVSLWGHSLSS